MNRPGEAIVHYQRAAELQTQTPIEALLSMEEMATCKILTRKFDPGARIWLLHMCEFRLTSAFTHLLSRVAGDYDGALSVFTEMQLMCEEKGLRLPGTNTLVGEALMDKFYLQLHHYVYC